MKVVSRNTALVTRDELARQLRLPSVDDASTDAIDVQERQLLDQAVMAAVMWLEGAVGRVYADTVFERRFTMWPACLGAAAPLREVVAVTYLDESAATQTLDVSDLRFFEDGRLQLDQPPAITSGRPDSVVVCYRSGLDLSQPSPDVLPADLKMAVLMMAAHFYENPKAVADRRTQEVPLGAKYLIRPYVSYA